jgi:TonB family protein
MLEIWASAMYYIVEALLFWRNSMKKPHKFLTIILNTITIIFLFATIAFSQSLQFDYRYRMEPIIADTPPDVSGRPNIDYPESARKNGVEGILKATVTLGADGRTSDISITQSLPDGVDEAVTKGLQTLYFKPAQLNGQPVSAKLYFEFTVSAVYSEDDKNAGKPKIISQPDAVYPAKYRNEKWKEKVSVKILFNSDGTLKVLGTNSVMPREFDKAAVEAAEKIKFQPAVHKKSKKPISVQMTVEYKFKS